jgi:hypothetical protein
VKIISRALQGRKVVVATHVTSSETVVCTSYISPTNLKTQINIAN